MTTIPTYTHRFKRSENLSSVEDLTDVATMAVPAAITVDEKGRLTFLLMSKAATAGESAVRCELAVSGQTLYVVYAAGRVNDLIKLSVVFEDSKSEDHLEVTTKPSEAAKAAQHLLLSYFQAPRHLVRRMRVSEVRFIPDSQKLTLSGDEKQLVCDFDRVALKLGRALCAAVRFGTYRPFVPELVAYDLTFSQLPELVQLGAKSALPEQGERLSIPNWRAWLKPFANPKDETKARSKSRMSNRAAQYANQAL